MLGAGALYTVPKFGNVWSKYIQDVEYQVITKFDDVIGDPKMA